MPKPILVSENEMPRRELQFTSQSNPGGVLKSVQTKGNSLTNFLPTEVTSNPNFGTAATVESQIFDGVVSGLSNRNENGIGGNAFAADRDAELPKTNVSRRSFINAVRDRRAALQTSEETALDFSFVREQYPSPLRSDLRRDYLALEVPARIPAALGANLPLAISILEGGQALSGLPDDVWQQFTEHCMESLYIHRYAKDAAFRLQPTPDRITASGVDMKACRAAAREAIEARKSELEAIELAEIYLQRQIVILAAISGKSPEEFL